VDRIGWELGVGLCEQFAGARLKVPIVQATL